MASASDKSHEENILQDHYANLIRTLSGSIDDILFGLVSHRVISINDKNRIKEQSSLSDARVEYLLDHHIYRSLAVGETDPFMKLLDIMKGIAYCKPLALSIARDLKGDRRTDEPSTTRKVAIRLRTITRSTSWLGSLFSSSSPKTSRRSEPTTPLIDEEEDTADDEIIIQLSRRLVQNAEIMYNIITVS